VSRTGSKLMTHGSRHVARSIGVAALTFGASLLVALALVTADPAAAPQPAAAARAGSARGTVPVDLTGYWVSLVTEDWRWRMVAPAKGDYQGVPLNPAGRKLADTWNPSMDGACEAYGAAGLLRMPGRLHITWEDDDTLKLETDAGQQTRLLRFRPSGPPPGSRSLQGYSVAEWVQGGRGRGLGGFGGLGGGGGGGVRWAPLRVRTTELSGGWLRRNGVPYSEQATLTEQFLLLRERPDAEVQWLTVLTTVEDPTYLVGSFITSTNFKREPDGSKWNQKPCRSR